MTTEHMIYEAEMTVPPRKESEVRSEQKWAAYVFLVVLILLGIGGMALLCYRLEQPVPIPLVGP